MNVTVTIQLSDAPTSIISSSLIKKSEVPSKEAVLSIPDCVSVPAGR